MRVPGHRRPRLRPRRACVHDPVRERGAARRRAGRRDGGHDAAPRLRHRHPPGHPAECGVLRAHVIRPVRRSSRVRVPADRRGGLRHVRLGCPTPAIDRDPDRAPAGVRVQTDLGEVVADDLVLTVPIDQLLPVLDATPEERDLAGRVRHLDYYTTVVSATGLPHEAFYLVDEHTRPGAERGHPVAFHHRYPDRDIYACYSYGTGGTGGTGDIDGRDIEDRLREN